MDKFETELIKMTDEKLIEFLRYNNLLSSGFLCEICNISPIQVAYNRVKDGFAWYCLERSCCEYKKYL